MRWGLDIADQLSAKPLNLRGLEVCLSLFAGDTSLSQTTTADLEDSDSYNLLYSTDARQGRRDPERRQLCTV